MCFDDPLKRPSPRLRVFQPLSLNVASSSARRPLVVLPLLALGRPLRIDSCFLRFLHVWKEVGAFQSMLDIVRGFVILLLSLSRPRRPSPTSRVQIT